MGATPQYTGPEYTIPDIRRDDAKKSPFQQPSVGRIVLYVLPDGPRRGEVRPAIITRPWQPIENEASPGMSNLSVFQDQFDDFDDGERKPRWVGSVLFDSEGKPGTWHWPTRV